MNDLKPSLQNTIEIGELFRIAFRTFKKNTGLVIGGTLFLNLVPFILVGIPILAVCMGFIMTGAGADSNIEELFGKLLLPITFAIPIFLCVYSVFRVGWISICLKLAANEPVSFMEFKSALSMFWPFLGVQLLMFLCVSAGLLLFIAPGIFLAVRLAFAPYLLIDRRLGPVESLKESWNLVTGFSWQVLLINVTAAVGSHITNMIPFLGLILAPICIGYCDLLMTSAYKVRAGTLPEAEAIS